MPDATIIPFPSRKSRDEAATDEPVQTWDFSVDAFLPEETDPESRDEVEYRTQRLNAMITHLSAHLTMEQISSLEQFIADLVYAVSEAAFHEGVLDATTGILETTLVETSEEQ